MLIVLGLLGLNTLGLVAILPTSRSLRPLELIALSFAIGAGIATLCFFLLLALGLALSGFRMALVIMGATILQAALRFVAREHQVETPRPHLAKPPLAPLDGFLLCGIGCIVVGATAVAVYWPPHTWDALAIWVVKARALALSGMVHAVTSGAHPYYPLHLPLELSFLLHLGGVALAKVLFPLYYAALLLVFALSLTRFCHRSVALGFTLMLAAVPFLLRHATIACADLTFTFYYVGGTLLLHRFTVTEDGTEQSDLLVLTGLLLGIASWTRPEGLMYFVINSAVLIAFSARRRIRLTSLAKYGIAYGAFALPWMVYSRAMGYHNYLFENVVSATREVLSAQVDWGRICSILIYLGQQIIDTRTWGWVCILFLGAVILYPRQVRANSFLLAVIGLNILGLVLQYYVAPTSGNPLIWWLTTGFNRMALHFAPLLLFYSGLCFNQDLLAWLARARRLIAGS